MSAKTFVLRPIAKKDIDDLVGLAKISGPGMTSLPHDKAYLAKQIERSQTSFTKKVDNPNDEKYLFVLEDCDNKKIVGVSGIEASSGGAVPMYSFKLVHKLTVSRVVDARYEMSILHLANDYQNKTEICTLYLHPGYRKYKVGSFLSKVRFLYMKLNPNRFADTVFAEMRGYFDAQGVSPFWKGVMQKFFPMSFHEADVLSVVSDKQFIADLIPHYPIYVDLLPKYAQNCIGKPHNNTRAALKILSQEGFQYQHYVDIFDAGPTVEVPFQSIRTIRKSMIRPVKFKTGTQAIPLMLASTKDPFKAYTVFGEITDSVVNVEKAFSKRLSAETEFCIYMG